MEGREILSEISSRAEKEPLFCGQLWVGAANSGLDFRVNAAEPVDFWGVELVDRLKMCSKRARGSDLSGDRHRLCAGWGLAGVPCAEEQLLKRGAAKGEGLAAFGPAGWACKAACKRDLRDLSQGVCKAMC